MEPVRVAIVAEYYPRQNNEVLGIWAHRQAVAAAAAGAEVRVVVLNRPIPSSAALRGGSWREIFASMHHPSRRTIDGIEVNYIPYMAPPRPWSYSTWGAWAAPSLALALKRLKSRFPFDLIHAHYAAPAGDAIRRIRRPEPLVISVHGGDVIGVANRSRTGRRNVEAAFTRSDLVLANSKMIAEMSRKLGAKNVEVLHLGTDVGPEVPQFNSAPPKRNTLVTVSHLVKRKRHIDVLQALNLLKDSHPNLRWQIVGDGHERANLENAVRELRLEDRVDFLGQRRHEEALAIARKGGLFVLPSVDEAFGVAYIEAMAGGVPAIACAGEPGPEEIASLGEGMQLIQAMDPASIATEIKTILDNPKLHQKLSTSAYHTVKENFTWERCGEATVRAYRKALANRDGKTTSYR